MCNHFHMCIVVAQSKHLHTRMTETRALLKRLGLHWNCFVTQGDCGEYKQTQSSEGAPPMNRLSTVPGTESPESMDNQRSKCYFIFFFYPQTTLNKPWNLWRASSWCAFTVSAPRVISKCPTCMKTISNSYQMGCRPSWRSGYRNALFSDSHWIHPSSCWI